MKAQDTVMGKQEQLDKLLERGIVATLLVGELGCEALIKTQAEISFRAGIKEVVEWVRYEGNQNAHLSMTRDILIKHPDLQTKLKEWGI